MKKSHRPSVGQISFLFAAQKVLLSPFWEAFSWISFYFFRLTCAFCQWSIASHCKEQEQMKARHRQRQRQRKRHGRCWSWRRWWCFIQSSWADFGFATLHTWIGLRCVALGWAGLGWVDEHLRLKQSKARQRTVQLVIF